MTGIHVVTLLWRNERYAEGFIASHARAATAAQADVRLTLVVNGDEGQPALRRALRAAATNDLGCDQFSVLELESNRGYGGGMNAAINETAQHDEWTVFANFDQEFGPDSYAALALLREEPSLCVARVGDLHSPEARECGPSRIGAGLRIRPSDASEWGQTPRTVQAGNGCFIAVSARALRARLDEFGEVFWAELFAYGEDLDLFLWADTSGIPVYYRPDLTVRHAHAGSFNGVYQTVRRPPEWRALIDRNRFAVYRAHRHGLHEGLAFAAWEVLRVLQTAARGRFSLRRYLKAAKDGRKLGERRKAARLRLRP